MLDSRPGRVVALLAVGVLLAVVLVGRLPPFGHRGRLENRLHRRHGLPILGRRGRERAAVVDGVGKTVQLSRKARIGNPVVVDHATPHEIEPG